MRHPWVVALFAAAMGLLEAAVVVYLRRIYYPGGFAFPLAPLDAPILRIEIAREAMTLIMLACVGHLAAARFWPRLMAFLFAFGIWDLVYYAGLKLFLDWPSGLLAPDILFLIPVVWVGPVLAPALVAVAFVVGSLLLHRAPPERLRVGAADLFLAVASAGIILAAFLRPSGDPGEPRFPWFLFGAGYVVGIGLLIRLRRRCERRRGGGA